MEELVRAVEKIAEKTWVDYLLMVSPIVISIVAVWISIAVAKKQNKIALFNMKYKAVCLIKAIFDFEKTIDEEIDAKAILLCFDMSFNTDLVQQESKAALVKASNVLAQIDNDLSILYYTSKGRYKVMINDILKSLSEVLANAIVGRTNRKEIEHLHTACIKFNSLGYDKIQRKLKI